MLEPKGIAWAGLYAQDLPALADFYRDIVGLPQIESGEHCCIFAVGAGALFEIWGKGSSQSGRKSPQQQSVIVGFLVAQLEPVVAQLQARGLTPDGEIGSYLGSRWIYYTDPEGNRFELKDNQG